MRAPKPSYTPGATTISSAFSIRLSFVAADIDSAVFPWLVLLAVPFVVAFVIVIYDSSDDSSDETSSGKVLQVANLIDVCPNRYLNSYLYTQKFFPILFFFRYKAASNLLLRLQSCDGSADRMSLLADRFSLLADRPSCLADR